MTNSNGEVQSAYKFGEVEVDFVKRQVTRKGEELHLTPIKYKLLSTLIKYADRVVTHNHLLREAWGAEY